VAHSEFCAIALFKLVEQLQAQAQAGVEKRRDFAARRAYAELMAQRDQLVQAEPRLEPIFDSLARHYPSLVNAYDNALIPLTNNAKVLDAKRTAWISTTKTCGL
jgi:hypothetical protein